MPLIALTRPVPSSMAACELTHLARTQIDIPRAMAQHAAYEDSLRSLGVQVIELEPTPELPDSAFIEDTAVVLPEFAVITRPGALSRRPETAAVEKALVPFRRIARITAPGTLDGGDVLVIAQTRQIFAGLSSRSNQAGIEQLRDLTRAAGYEVSMISMCDCLHLKSAATQIAPLHEPPLLLINAHWVSPGAFGGIECLPIHPVEPNAANTLRVGSELLAASQFPLTRHILHLHGMPPMPIDNDELAKAEGALTCCSLIFESAPSI